MKKLYILVVLATLSFSSKAQNFVYSTDQHIVETLTNPFTSHYIKFTTPSPEEITYKYEKISNSMPAEWDFSLCDYNSCYVGVPDLGTMTTITLVDSQNEVGGFFNLTANSQGVSGEGTIVMYVFDSNDHERGDTVSWHLSFEGIVSINEFEASESFKVYPNPATDLLNIASESNYSGAIFNSLGKKVFSLKGNMNETIDVSNLAKGVYFISCKNESGFTFNRQLIIQ
ncbi:MAG: hypothetical protein ACI8VT_002332 [Saprospiraceae bacterium]|jgi:hypothetical protein